MRRAGPSTDPILKKINSWFQLNLNTGANRVPKELKITWSGWEVHKELEYEAIVAERDAILAKEEAGRDPAVVLDAGQKRGKELAAFNQARSALWRALPPAEQTRYEDIARTWTLQGPPDNVRLL